MAKMFLPGNEFVDAADPVKELNILVAQHVERLSPEQQTGRQYDNQ